MIDPTLVLAGSAEPVAQLLVRCGAFHVRHDATFRWSSGIEAPVYLDVRRAGGDPPVREAIVAHLVHLVRSWCGPIDAVAGIAASGVVWSSLVAERLAVPHLTVRTEERPHGLSGRVAPGQSRLSRRVALIDDLVATGATASAAVASLREVGARTAALISVANWSFPQSRTSLAQAGVPAKSLVSFPQLIRAAISYGLWDPQRSEDLLAVYLRHNARPRILPTDLAGVTVAGLANDDELRNGDIAFGPAAHLDARRVRAARRAGTVVIGVGEANKRRVRYDVHITNAAVSMASVPGARMLVSADEHGFWQVRSQKSHSVVPPLSIGRTPPPPEEAVQHIVHFLGQGFALDDALLLAQAAARRFAGFEIDLRDTAGRSSLAVPRR